MTDRELIQTVPLAAYEAQAERNTRLVAHMAILWAVSVLIMGIVLLFAISYEAEMTEEITETTTEYNQDADNYGSNYISGGDMNGSTSISQEDND